MRVVITGGTGLIGRALSTELVGAGHDVTVLSRDPGRTEPADGVNVHGWDARSVEPLIQLFDACDGVVHLVGENVAGGRWTAARKQRIVDSRLDSTTAVTEAFASVEKPPRVLLQASAVGIYGDRGDEELTEESPPGGPGFLEDLCVDWENASAPVESHGARRVLLRTGVVLARDGGALPRMLLPFRLCVGGPVGGGAQWFPWIHAADEVGAIRFLLESESASGAFNLAAPESVTNAEFSRELGSVLRRPAFLPTPAAALRLAFGEMASVLLASLRVQPQRLQKEGYVFRYPGAEGALRNLL